jgi:hypothetical protein
MVVKDGVVTFTSDASDATTRDAILLSGDNAGVSYEYKGGVSEYGGSTWEDIASYKCTLQ